MFHTYLDDITGCIITMPRFPRLLIFKTVIVIVQYRKSEFSQKINCVSLPACFGNIIFPCSLAFFHTEKVCTLLTWGQATFPGTQTAPGDGTIAHPSLLVGCRGRYVHQCSPQHSWNTNF